MTRSTTVRHAALLCCAAARFCGVVTCRLVDIAALCGVRRSEAAKLFRENEPQFRRTVRRTMQGGSHLGEHFPRLI